MPAQPADSDLLKPDHGHIIEREVEFKPGAAPELYHAIDQQDYIAIVARTPNGTIPIVRQYRPALEVTPHELATLFLSGEFVLQLHIGALMLAGMRGHLDLAALR